MKNLFIVIVRYIVNYEEIDSHIENHIKFLEVNYKNGTFIASGPQVPKTGGIIIAKSENRLLLEKILSKDPFVTCRIGEYQIYEFTPIFHAPEFKAILDSLETYPI